MTRDERAVRTLDAARVKNAQKARAHRDNGPTGFDDLRDGCAASLHRTGDLSFTPRDNRRFKDMIYAWGDVMDWLAARGLKVPALDEYNSL